MAAVTIECAVAWRFGSLIAQPMEARGAARQRGWGSAHPGAITSAEPTHESAEVDNLVPDSRRRT
jgi:hypothetical protein